MKVKNKLTGEINILKVDEDYFNIYKDDGEFVCPVTLKELNEGWEDAPEEPKDYWFINSLGEVICPCDTTDWVAEDDAYHKAIGNYFGTQEEAELAVRKLKAWKRLKDKGFRFIGKTYETDKRFGSVFYKVDEDTYSEDIIDNLDTCFGGEE